MKRLLAFSVCAMLAMVAVSEAAQIDFSQTDTTTAPDDWNTAYGLTGVFLMRDISSGQPQGDLQHPGLPTYIDGFVEGFPGQGGGNGGSGGGGGGGGNPATGDLYYDLDLNAGKQFQFTTLFYNSTYGTENNLQGSDVALSVRLLGENDPDDDWHDITVAELEGGIFMSWDVIVYTDDANKTVTLDVEYVNGDGSVAAGFFLDNVQPAGAAPIPEPATVGILLVGAAGLIARRRSR